MSYKFYNANARGKFHNELSKIAQRNGIILDDVNFVEPLLDSRYDRVCYKDLTVGDFAENNPKGVYLITMNGHITCCIDGIIYDTFDCRDRIMKCAWEVY